MMLINFLQTRIVNKHWYFACQHGPRECFGNKVQACSLQQNVTQRVHLDFINCVMSNPDPASEQGAEDVRTLSLTHTATIVLILSFSVLLKWEFPGRR